jgi:ribosome biogenesis GTPase
MSKKRGKKPERTDFKKNHQGRVRREDLTRKFHDSQGTGLDDVRTGERVSGKGELTRKRTLSAPEVDPSATTGESAVSGLVLNVHGLVCRVFGDDGVQYSCAIRRVLKSVSIDQRQVVAAGDRVSIRVPSNGDGFIEHVHPRVAGTLSRSSKGRQHVIAANVDWMMIVSSLVEPILKPHLIDRYLLSAEQFGIRPVICLNKVDLVDGADYQKLMGSYAQLGYRILLCSAATGQGIEPLRRLLRGRQSVVAGQSGVGKSSLLNAIEPGLGLRVSYVSEANQKGRHTTTTADLIPLTNGGYVIDTPGIKQFSLWDISPKEVANLMPDFRPYVSQCRYPDCQHLHENSCAVKEGVADGRIDPRRYDSYCHLLEDNLTGDN